MTQKDNRLHAIAGGAENSRTGAGKSAFPEFLGVSRRAGVVCYDMDFRARAVACFGAQKEDYVEDYRVLEQFIFRSR